MAKFEKVKKYEDADIAMPIQKTEGAAGYDMVAAEDYVIPSFWLMTAELAASLEGTIQPDEYFSLETMARLTKETGYKPTLVSTGMKCELEEGTFLMLSVRSSSPLKYWLMMANSVGIIDRDYYNNPDNEGEIFFQIYNMSPFNIQIKKGETIGQGIILPYLSTGDKTGGVRLGGFGSTDLYDEDFK